MMSKTVLITGANKGIGYEIARQLLQKGLHVIISGRDEKRLTEAYNMLKSNHDNVNSLLMDVGEESSVNQAVQRLSSENIKIDVLINNAAVSFKSDHSIIEEDFSVVRDTLNVNSYGPLRVTRAFLPLINNPGRIINISSSGGSMSQPVGGWSPAYCVSKTTLNAITRFLALELQQRGIVVNSVCPGWVQTDMGGRSAPRTVDQGAETPVWLATEAPLNITGSFIKDKKVMPW